MGKSTEELFVEEIKAIMKKYKVQVRSYEDYNGKDEYCGSSYHFEGNGIDIEISSFEA